MGPFLVTKATIVLSVDVAPTFGRPGSSSRTMRTPVGPTSAWETVREAQERERDAGRPVDPNMTLGDALEILGR